MTEIGTKQLKAMNCGAINRVEDLKGQVDRFVMEPKYDGFRLIAHVGDGFVHFYTRSMKRQDGKLPHIEAQLLASFAAGTVLDGEIVALEKGDDGRVTNNFEHVQSVMLSKGDEHLRKNEARPLSYVVFDVTFAGGIDIRSKPLSHRRALLEAKFAEQPLAHVTLTPQWPASDSIYETLCELGFEGAVVKASGSPYINGARGKGWHKMKRQDDVDVIITGYMAGRGKFDGLVGAVKFGQPCPKTGEIVERGQASGMDDAERAEMTKNADALLGTVITVAHMGIMPGGVKMRHPQFKRFRPDKPVDEIVWHNQAA